MTVQPRQGNVESFLHFVRFASVLVGAPIDVDLIGDRMPCDFVLVILESNVPVTVVGHGDDGLVMEEYAVAATASHNAFDWLYRTAHDGTPLHSATQGPFNESEQRVVSMEPAGDRNGAPTDLRPAQTCSQFDKIVTRRTEMSIKAYRGSSGWGAPILTIDNNGWVYQGTPVFGKPIMKISGEQIYQGSTSWGSPIATVKGEYVYRGTGCLSAPVALVDGRYVYSGTTKMGGPIANVSSGGRMSAAAAAVYLLLM
jgi:hypothetical protein